MSLNKRFQVVQNLYDIATVKWKAPVTFSALNQYPTGKRIPVEYHKNETYYGLPFTIQNKINVSEFVDKFVDKSNDSLFKYSKKFVGGDCISPIIFAIKEFLDLPTSFLSADFLQYEKDDIIPLGRFASHRRLVQLEKVSSFSKQDYYESYSLLQVGDILSTYFPHTRMVTGKPHIVRFSNGLIDGDNSYVVLVENKSTLAMSVI